MDKLTAAQRSRLMSSVRSANTAPEMAVRSLVHRMGYRYRLYVKELPGKPDLVFPRRRKIILVNGCFWHGHSCRSGRNRPSSNNPYWALKLERNKKRDRAAKRKLRRLGWNVLVLWECELNDEAALQERIGNFLVAAHHGQAGDAQQRQTNHHERRMPAASR
jgi:DNA mismatch endonuclease (patch repair protein)